MSGYQSIHAGVRLALGFTTAVLVLVAQVQADTGAATTVRDVVEKVRSTVVSEQATTTPEALDKKLRDIISPVFDFKTMARSSLAQHWKSASPAEQEEFVALFSDLLAHTYLKRIRENAADSEIAIVGERKQTDDKFLVQTKVSYEKDQTAAIDYRLRRKDGSWLVYDVIIENIGLVSNYRQEFDGIVKKDNVSGLIAKLREKKAGES